MNRFILILCVFLFSAGASQAQIMNPVKWSYAAKKINKTEAIVYIKATIDEGWHLYSQNMKEGGPVKTTFAFPASKEYKLVGKTSEPKPITEFEKAFDMEVSYFENTVMFEQKVSIKGNKPVNVKGSVEFMVCNDEQCLPPDEVAFTIPVK